jgi:hypothetical protein
MVAEMSHEQRTVVGAAVHDVVDALADEVGVDLAAAKAKEEGRLHRADTGQGEQGVDVDAAQARGYVSAGDVV